MIAVFFKNRKAEAEAEIESAAIVAQGQTALQERMVRMLRQEAKLAWMPAPTHLAPPNGVKNSFSVRKVVSSAY
jgi:hypothetical protein